MGFFEFVFAFMFVIPIAALMCFLLYKLNADAKEVIKADNQKRAIKSSENLHNNRRYVPGYNKTSERQFSYNNPYEPKSFGSTAAEIKRREQEKQVIERKVEKQLKPQKPLSKHKRRKERKNRKKDKAK